MKPSRSIVVSLVLLWTGAGIAACRGALEPEAVAEDARSDASHADATPSDASDGATAVCRLESSTCVGSPQCCGPISGTIVDFDAGCLGATKTIDCERLGATCAYSTGNGCVFRVVNGVREVLAVGSELDPAYLSTVQLCDKELTGYVATLRFKPRCP